MQWGRMGRGTPAEWGRLSPSAPLRQLARHWPSAPGATAMARAALVPVRASEDTFALGSCGSRGRVEEPHP